MTARWSHAVPPAAGQTLRVRTTDPVAGARWEAFVAATPAATIYHHPLWLTVLQVGYGHQPAGLLCEDAAGNVRGVLPLVRTHGLLTGRRLVSLPHTPVCGPVALDAEAAAALVRAAERLAAGVTLLLKAAPGRAPNAGGLGGAWMPWEETYILELPSHPEQLRLGNARNHARIRWAAGKAERAGVRVREAESEHDVRTWYRLYLATMRDHAVPPRPLRFFLAAWRLLRPAGMMQLLLAEQWHEGERRLLAGSVVFRHGDTVHYAFNGRLASALPLRPNDVIQWRAIHDACAAGYRWYDFGEVDAGNRGLAEFKSKWGARPERLYRLYTPAPSRAERTSIAEAGRIRQAAERAWRRVPLSVTAHLGDVLYRLG